MSNVDVPGDLAKKDFNTSVVFCLILKWEKGYISSKTKLILIEL